MMLGTCSAREPSALIVHGGVDHPASAADLDTLVQVRSVAAALRALGCTVETLEISLDFGRHASEILRYGPSFVVNLVEQIDGRDALLPLAAYLLDRTGLPYTGAPSGVLATTTHKMNTKRLLRAMGIPTPDWIEPSFSGRENSAEGSDDLYIVKSATEHASIGLTEAAVVPAHAAASRIRWATRKYGGTWFAERYVHGREFNLGLLADGGDPQVLPIAEIEFHDFPGNAPRIVGYAAKWEPDSPAYRNTRRCFLDIEHEPELARRLSDIAQRCWRVFGLGGYARLDFRIDLKGKPWVLEINANPCLSPDGGFAAATEKAGISYVDMIRRIVRGAGVELSPLIHGVRV